MKIPKGYSEYKGTDLNKKPCLILDHALYGLVQAVRQFYKKLIEVSVRKLKFIKCLNEPCLLMQENEIGIIIISLYIDNALCVGDILAIEKFKKEIKVYYFTKEEGAVNEYVGCMIKRVNSAVYFNQTDLIKKIEEKFEEELNNVREYWTPATPGQGTVRTKEGHKCRNDSKQFKYR